VVNATGAPGRWAILAGTAVAVLAAGAVLAARVPLTERGHLDRGPEGGEIVRTATWLLSGKRVLATLPLESVSGLSLQEAAFHSSPSTTTTLARLQVTRAAGSPLALTDWAEPDQVAALQDALVRAGRLELLSGEPRIQ